MDGQAGGTAETTAPDSDRVPNQATQDLRERQAVAVDNLRAESELTRAKARFINLTCEFMAAAVPLLQADFLKFMRSKTS